MTATRKINGTPTAGAAAELPPPAYFLSLTVENVCCFSKPQMLDLSDGSNRPRQWTILLGDNGVGKTTILQCLAGMQPIEHQLQNSDEKILTPMFYERDSWGRFRNNFFFPERGDGSLFQIATDMFWNGSLVAPEKGVRKTYWQVEGKRDLTTASSAKLNLRGLICYGYGANRHLSTTDLSEWQNADTTASLFDENAMLISAEEWLLQTDYATKSLEGADQKRAAERLDRIKKALCDLLPDVSGIDFKPTKTVPIRITAQAKTPYGWVSIRDMSLGYRTMMTWMVDFASRLLERYPDSPNPLQEPAIALIDEIDLHLHPKWQRTLIQDLSRTFPNTQFIVSAHSPLVVQSAENANIVLLQREGDHVVIRNNMEMRKGLRVDQLLTSDLFGLESARPPEFEAAINEQSRLLSKSRLTAKDKARLRELEAEIGSMPNGETAQDFETMDFIRQAAKLMRQTK